MNNTEATLTVPSIEATSESGISITVDPIADGIRGALLRKLMEDTAHAIIEINDHTRCGVSIRDYVAQHKEMELITNDQISNELCRKMLDNNTLICVRFVQKDTLRDSDVYGADIDSALISAIEVLEKEKK